MNKPKTKSKPRKIGDKKSKVRRRLRAAINETPAQFSASARRSGALSDE